MNHFSSITITKTFRFEMAHALANHKGACRNIHGHSYKLNISISGFPVSDSQRSDFGMVMDFSELSAIVKENILQYFDHALVLNESDATRFPAIEKTSRVIYVPFAPTCEMMLIHFCRILTPLLPEHVALHAVRLKETATSYAEWTAIAHPEY